MDIVVANDAVLVRLVMELNEVVANAADNESLAVYQLEIGCEWRRWEHELSAGCAYSMALGRLGWRGSEKSNY